MIRVFIGVDRRQFVAANVLAHSIERNASQPVAITKLYRDTLPVKRLGLTEFTYTRYLVPWLCDYEGTAIFMDADMLCLGDVAKLMEYAPKSKSVSVANVTEFERPSLMIFRNEDCTALTPELITNGTPQDFSWGTMETTIPPEWNHILGYSEPCLDPQLIHYTMGIPYFGEISSMGLGFEAEWWCAHEEMVSSASWLELMGQSVHARAVLGQMEQNWSAWQKLKQEQAKTDSNSSS